MCSTVQRHLSSTATARPQPTLLRGNLEDETSRLPHEWKHTLCDSLIELRCWGDLVLGVRRPIAIDGFGVGAVCAVPAVATTYPRQLIGHGGEQVV